MKMLSVTLLLRKKVPWKIVKSAWNGKENSQSTQPYPNTCSFQITKVRDLAFLQNDENIIYSLQIYPFQAKQDAVFEWEVQKRKQFKR